MTATVTKEPVAPDVTAEELQRAIDLRIQAGAVRAWVETSNDQRFLMAEWRVT